MSNESENANTSATVAPATNRKRQPARKAKSAPKPDRTKKAPSKATDRTTKKAEVIAAHALAPLRRFRTFADQEANYTQTG